MLELSARAGLSPIEWTVPTWRCLTGNVVSQQGESVGVLWQQWADMLSGQFRETEPAKRIVDDTGSTLLEGSWTAQATSQTVITLRARIPKAYQPPGLEDVQREELRSVTERLPDTVARLEAAHQPRS
jgi:hypothetical protein